MAEQVADVDDVEEDDDVDEGPVPSGFVQHALRFATVVALGLIAVLPLAGNELRAQDVDPVFMRNLVERAARFGGTYYDNAIHNRGTFEPLAYDIARRVTSFDSYWYAVSAMIAAMGAAMAFVAARTARRFGANRSVALGVAVIAYLQLTMAGHGWSRVLYIRNITTLLLGVVWVLAISERPWADRRHARWTAIAVGALLGCVVEQLLTSVFTGAVVGLVALALLYERRPPEERAGHLIWSVGAAVTAFVATPVWYVLRGGFAEYWAGWWTYARFMGEGPGRSLSSQLSLGWDRWYEFHRDNPSVVLLLLAFVAAMWLTWRDLDRRGRVLHAGLLAWWAAGWLELVLSQRYSAHYYIVIGIPTILIGAALAGHVCRTVALVRPDAAASLAVPLAAVVLGVYLTSPTIFHQDWELTTGFDGVTAAAQSREKNLGGGDRSVRAVLDLVSQDDDALLAWTFDPFLYPKYHRVSATRFQWKFFLQGAIYLGRTRPEYVLPESWRWFAEDVEESQPVAFVETEVPDADTPFDQYVRSGFREVYPGNAAKVWLKADVADDLLRPTSAARPWVDEGERVDGTGWFVEGTSATFRVGATPADADPLLLGRQPCTRYDLTADPGNGQLLQALQLRFDSETHPDEERQMLAIEGDRAGSGSTGLGPLGFEAMPSNVTAPGPVPLSIVVGRRSAALVIDGQLRAAVRLEPSVTRLSLVTASPELQLSDLALRPAPEGGGCPGPSDGSE